jgi:hypothetical protein
MLGTYNISSESRYGDMVIHVNEETRTYSINNAFCKGSFVRPVTGQRVCIVRFQGWIKLSDYDDRYGDGGSGGQYDDAVVVIEGDSVEVHSAFAPAFWLHFRITI